MKGSRAGAPPTDLLVCFPSRSHLALTHRPINSPSRPSHRSLSSPLFRAPNKSSRANRSRTQLGSDIGSEPTSPKVTCAGQIKVRHHHHKNLAGPRRPGQKNWVEALGIKKDVMNFLGALRSLRPSMRCFGSFSGAVDCCSDEEEEDGEEEEIGGGSQSRSVFSKWLMVLEEENREGTKNEELIEEEKEEEEEEEEETELPPKNALLLMRCRSAPAKGREEERAEDKEEEEEEERLMLMSYAPDFFKLSTEIAKETWVVGSVDPLMVRSRSWRR